MHRELDSNQVPERAGFRKDHSTMDQIFILNQIIEKAKQYNFEINFLFVDFCKAFESIKHSYLWNSFNK